MSSSSGCYMALSNQDVFLIQDSWAKLRPIGLQEIGLAVLFQLFTDEPQTIRLFYDIIDDGVKITQELLRKNKKVTHHAQRLAASLDKIVETLENELELKKIFGRLGKTHKFRKVDAKNFELLKPVLVAVLTSTLPDLTDDAIVAWSKAYDIIKAGIVRNMT